MRAFTRLLPVLILIVFGITAVWLYRAKATVEQAAEYAPAGVGQTLIPAGTAIPAVLRNGIPESARAGDSVRAFVSNPVVVNGRAVIAPEAQLQGELQEILITGEEARVSMNFSGLRICSAPIAIETRRVVAVVPVETDVDIASAAFRAVLGASLGAAIGAGSGDLRVIERGLFEGLSSSALQKSIPIRIILAHDVQVTY